MKLNGLYKTRGKYGQVKTWGYVSKVNNRTGLCMVRWPNNPPDYKYSEMGTHEIRSWVREGLIWKD